LITITWSNKPRRRLPNEAFGHTVLPRALKTGSFGLDAEVLEQLNDFIIEVCTAVEDPGATRGIIWKGFAQLLDHPCARQILRHIEVQDAPPVMGEHKEAIESTEGERWHSEEVHRCDDFTVVLQERLPSLCWIRISRRSSHLPQHLSFRDIEAKYLELAVNPWRSPSPVFGHHTENEFTQFPVHAFSSCTLAMPG
jgi:hypothetical protein